MSLISEVKNTVKFLSLKRNKLAILHCISDYPTKISDTQLANILLLKKIKYVVGFSDHTLGESSSCVAVALGANIIEKHITLDKSLPGPDHVCSLPCKDLKKFVENLNNIKKSISSRIRKLTKQEEITKLIARKSLYFKKDLNKNHKIKYDDLISLRPFNNGISPSLYKKIVNKKLSQKVKKYSKIKFSNIKN
jgi:sialic acid synthase SpsE|tara:strand:+ start:130 stop:708 length:579 start_codon:yes stop_codon:yes gene_type:complete